MKNVFNKYLSPFLLYALFGAIPVISVISPRAFGGVAPAIALLLMCGMLFLAPSRRRLPLFSLPTAGFLSLIAALCFLSILWGQYKAEIFEQSVKITYLFIGGYALLNYTHYADDETRTRINKILMMAFLAGTILTVLELTLGFPLNRLVRNISFDEKVPKSLTNHAVIVFSLLIWPVIYLLIKKGLKKQSALLWIAWTIFVIVFSKSATATVTLVMAAGAFLLMPRMPIFFIRGLMGLTCVGILAAPLLAHGAFTAFAERMSTWKGANAAQRLEIWSAVAAKIAEKPWTGWGVEASRHFTNLNMERIYFKQKTILHPHNAPLQIWAELGLPGALAVTAFALYLLNRIGQLPLAERRVAVALFVSIAIVMSVGYGVWQSWWIGLVFVSVAAFKIAQNKNPSA